MDKLTPGGLLVVKKLIGIASDEHDFARLREVSRLGRHKLNKEDQLIQDEVIRILAKGNRIEDFRYIFQHSSVMRQSIDDKRSISRFGTLWKIGAGIIVAAVTAYLAVENYFRG